MARTRAIATTVIALSMMLGSRPRSDDRSTSIEKDEKDDKTAHESSEYNTHDRFPRCVTVVLKVLHQVHSKCRHWQRCPFSTNDSVSLENYTGVKRSATA
jgi:hypothetical protein